MWKRTIGDGWQAKIAGLLITATKREDGQWLGHTVWKGETHTTLAETRQMVVKDLVSEVEEDDRRA